MDSTETNVQRKRAEEQFDLFLPADVESGIQQDEEWCEVVLDGDRRRIRFHDYGEIYEIPGLYERLFYAELDCTSPTQIREMLTEALKADRVNPRGLRVLDIGAGNGMVAEQLAAMGASSLVGVDILEEAAEAAERDRPDLYDAYYAVDLTDLPIEVYRALRAHGPNCMTAVAALGFGDMPPTAFAEAYNFVAPSGWIAFTIKEDFLEDDDPSGFNLLVRQMLDERALEIREESVYRHRRSVSGKPLHYTAIVAVKRANVREEWLEHALEGSGAAA